MANVLLIDDDGMFRELVADMVDSMGAHRIWNAVNGQVGLFILEQHAMDVIVCNLRMPVMNGIVFYDTLRTLPPWATIPVVLYTSGDEWPQIRTRAQHDPHLTHWKDPGSPREFQRICQTLGLASAAMKLAAR